MSQTKIEYYYKVTPKSETDKALDLLTRKADYCDKAVCDLLEKVGCEKYYPEAGAIRGGISAFSFDKKRDGFVKRKHGKGYIPSLENKAIKTAMDHLPRIMPEDLNSIIGTSRLFESEGEGYKVYEHPQMTQNRLLKWISEIDNPDLEPISKDLFECDKQWWNLQEKWDEHCILHYVEENTLSNDENELEYVKSITLSFSFMGYGYFATYDGNIILLDGPSILFDSFESYLEDREEDLEKILKSYSLYYTL